MPGVIAHDGFPNATPFSFGACYNSHTTLLLQTAEYLVTLRHPLAACISTYEKSGGLPANGLFCTRSNIEVWAERDLQTAGTNHGQLSRLRYIDAYLGYWRYYHLQLTGSGLAQDQRWQVVAYGRERLMQLAEALNRRFGAAGVVDDFQVERKLERHPDWLGASDIALHQIEAAWCAQGLPFLRVQLAEGW